MNRIISLGLWLTITAISVFAQPESADWYFEDPASSPYNGIGADRLYAYIGDVAPSKVVVVAILDSGVDIEHDDLKDNIWVNTDEISGNGIDDDQNGYVDDLHGWNFLGNAKGENITKETMEVTRLYAYYKKYFANKDLEKLSRKDKELYTDFLEYERIVQTKREEANYQIKDLEQNTQFIRQVLDTFNTYYPDQELTPSFLGSFDPGEHEFLKITKELFKNAREFGLELTTTKDLYIEIEASYAEVAAQSRENIDYRYNPDFNSRKIIGDNYDDQEECCYGNNNVRGGFAYHGTHVSGIVGALWNEKGINGIARHVRIMPVRTVPNGDEHDKDVANAIRYAVDNGADVINMSFGKGQSWNKKVVDDAVRYARKHDVLLVHGAGNDGANNDEVTNFPNAFFEKHCFLRRKAADNWIEVGAASYEGNDKAIAPFSNYGKTQVDLFAPGMYIYSTTPDGTYEYAQGTSMASPVVAGVAAIIRAYFPELRASQVKDILMQSVTPLQGEVIRPGDYTRMNGSELSRSGGIVNAYQAFKLAEARAEGKRGAAQKNENSKGRA
ncbi:MAG TPA: S8 family peptidase [Saprospiraceae bacterium]|nr:S8 family peptidase [Saprospiraceae bacterium]